MTSLIDKCKTWWRRADRRSEEARLKAELEQSGYTVVIGLSGKVLALY
jgi:hypothetical protein